MRYIIEIDLPDNETIKRVIDKCPVYWQIWGYYGDTIATPIPEACKSCSNHPSNGGSGICHCFREAIKVAVVHESKKEDK